MVGSEDQEGGTLARKVETFIREVVIPYENEPRRDAHGALDSLGEEIRGGRAKRAC